MIALGSDHGGFALKEEIKKHLTERGIPFTDYGTDSEASCDYPVYAALVTKTVTSGQAEKGILCCGTGIGMSMAANKHRGIRAACCSDTFSARLTREHNNANVLCFGGRVVGPGLAIDLADAFLDAEYQGGKHQVRVDMIAEIEREQSGR